jgi:hypothetical protein
MPEPDDAFEEAAALREQDERDRLDDEAERKRVRIAAADAADAIAPRFLEATESPATLTVTIQFDGPIKNPIDAAYTFGVDLGKELLTNAEVGGPWGWGDAHVESVTVEPVDYEYRLLKQSFACGLIPFGHVGALEDVQSQARAIPPWDLDQHGPHRIERRRTTTPGPWECVAEGRRRLTASDVPQVAHELGEAAAGQGT